MFDSRRLTIVTGKGGVGRSAVAAALALHSASTKEPVLALSMGQADGLAQHLGLDQASGQPVQTSDGVWCGAIEPSAALTDYIAAQTALMPARLGGRVFGALASTVPGIRDIITIGKCVHEARSGSWSAVVVDAAPTGQIESFLGAPSAVAALASRGRIHTQAVGLQHHLSDPAFTRVVTVATPEAMALTEAEAMIEAARDLGIAQPLDLLVNRRHPEPGFTAIPPGVGPVRAAAELGHALVLRESELLSHLSPALTLPHLFGALAPYEVAQRLAQEMTL